MAYDVVMNAKDYETARKIVKRIGNSRKCAQMIKNAPKELNILAKAFFKIKQVIQDVFPEVCKEDLLLYLFERAEGERLDSSGMCIPVNGNFCVIGICESVLLYEERLIYCLLHEIAHLRYPEHTERFYATVDVLVCIYNEKTGENIEDKYENREKRMEEWNGSKKK